uniref:tRNA methyltransferase 10 homolog C n=1 Tax=Tetraodon nigroviridis TaxID=99883 RepID=H3CVM8_TETNG
DEANELEQIDLEKWKSVMRSRMVEKAKDVNQGEESNSLLEASRELVAMWRYAGKHVPQEMTDEEIQVLAELSTKSSKKKYLKYLAIKEGHKRSRKEKQQRTKAEKEAAKLNSEQSICEEEPDQSGAAAKNTFLLQFWNRSLDKLLGWRCAQAMMFDQPLVFDMSYESSMSRREIDNTVSQLMEVEGWNRRAAEPFHLHFCNLQPDGAYMQEFLKRYGAEAWSRLLITCTDRQHVQVFPREQLVYLTADSPNVLRTFDHSKVYIVGALVDRSIQSGLSLANAKRLKLATARLPLSEFLHWEMGAKNLTLDQMIRIMLTLKETGKWEEALKFVPQRKHDGFYHPRTQKEVINSKAKGVTKEKQTFVKSGKQMLKSKN